MTTPVRRWASIAQAVEYSGGVNERTLRRHIAEGKLTGYKIGRLLRVDLNELDEKMRPIPTAKAS